MSDEIIRREFPAELVPSGDGRTLDLRIVPFNTVARVSDRPGEVYEEMWMPGAFDKQLSAPNRVDVLVNFEHQPGIGGVVGRGTELRDTGEALDMTARMLNAPDADKALELVNEKVLTGVSLEAIPLKSERGPDGIMRRIKARLVNVALCRSPAFPSAQVMAVRGSPAEPDEPAPDPPDGDPQVIRAELAAEEAEKNPPEFTEVELALQRVGFEPLVRRAVVRTPWDGAASRFTDEQWRRSCILDRGDQFDTAKTRYAFPVLEPNGDLNVNGMHAAAARLNQANASSEAKAAAARRLRRYYGMAGEEMPPSMMAMAGR